MVSKQFNRVEICYLFIFIFHGQVWNALCENEAAVPSIIEETGVPVIPSSAIEKPVISSKPNVPPVPNGSEESRESIRFGTTHYSRQEFTKDSGFLESVKDDSVFGLEFKTTGDSGVLLYAGSRWTYHYTDHIGLFMKEGKITFVFNCGLGPATMTTKNTYNDGKWHHVVFSREAQEGRLIIDHEEEVRNTTIDKKSTRTDLRYPFYVGGLSEEAAEESKDFLHGVNSSFPGCIRNVEAQGELWTVDKQSSAWNTTSCSSRIEGGSFCTEGSGCYFLNCECGGHTVGCKFKENGVKKCICGEGYEDQGGKCRAESIIDPSKAPVESVRFGSNPYSRQEYTLDENFLESLLEDGVFSLEFKTLGETGVMFYLGGNKPQNDNTGLFMKDGKVTYVFDCGEGSAEMTSQNTYNDGEWHHVQFSRKLQEGSLIIDEKEEIRGTSPGTSKHMNSAYPFYIGGLSKEGTEVYKKYLKDVYLSFPGCIRNVEGQGVLWTPDKISATFKTNKCTNRVEGGTFFYSGEGFLILHCKCGDHSTGCTLKEDSSKQCFCSAGYEDRGGICAVDKTLEDVPHSEEEHVGKCALPLHPHPDTSADPGEGIRFGNTPNSRQEFDVSVDFLESILDDSVFSLDFKTTGDTGILFYIGEGERHIDYAELFMRHGKIHFVFQLATGSTFLRSRNRYNDGAWHKAVFWRHGKEGRLVIDSGEVLQGSTPSTAHRLDVKSPIYVGGMSEEAIKNHEKNLRSAIPRYWYRGHSREDDVVIPPKSSSNYTSTHKPHRKQWKSRWNSQSVFTSFPGCIRNVEVQNVLFKPEMQKGAWNISTCSGTEEKGTFFSAGGGYLILIEKFRVGQEISISMDIKPRNLSGVLMAVHGKEDYLILQLVEGRVEFTVNNGNGPITTTYTPADDKHQLCDGKFHTIRATTRSNNSVTLNVDGVLQEKGVTVRRVSSTDTFDPLYVGGLPDSNFTPKKGVKTTDQFVGCIRNLELNESPQSMASAKPFGQVTLNSCPTT